MIRRLRATLPTATKRGLARTMQAVLVVLIGYGVWVGEPKTVTNGAAALAITFAPAVIERNYRVPIDPFLAFWLTTAVFLHTLGSAGLYASVGWWDHITHATSASVVAAIGYVAVRAVDAHHDEIRLPRRFFVVFLVAFVLAFGVVWELFEFGLDVFAARTGISMPLAQHGLDDTVKDLVFNSIGALIVGVWGQAYLTGVGERVLDRLPPDD
ncbi:hypothetical protein [Halopenitus persicus]|uniref:DUF2238 domain-containing protein n=1 Tax=Halopenitus persicus TaxID=1048396 RepID=A0A1H3GVL0_9EURY|nr:hypothetical protein [Halopenitus persicus]QHS17408.1 hypothetical protein GWK26_09770 [haloarchaeon 3A1-DGR]SDY07080.1 hypothetical protein SAMN05216564_1038 [Halopenitus persicus]